MACLMVEPTGGFCLALKRNIVAINVLFAYCISFY